jgi:tRNA modification GTPase
VSGDHRSGTSHSPDSKLETRNSKRAFSDTIVATSTAAGRAPRAIVRLSGPKAVQIASAVFESDPPLAGVPTYRSVEGTLVLTADEIRCPAAAYVMLAPRSYTREDVIELHTFSSPPLLAALTEALLAAGARPAEAGEFTRRAFLNGRIDLTQAEAVQSIIQARSEAELRVSQAQLGGAFRQAVEARRVRIAELLALIEASIDFVDQDIELIAPADAMARIDELIGEAESLAGAEPPAPPKDGVATAICGSPNAGKSSLLNALAGHARAIVTHIPGTTRDTIEHHVEAGGITFRLIDTAGVRDTDEEIEGEAIRRAHDALAAADLVLMVVDGSEELSGEARSMWGRVAGRQLPCVAVINKSDLPQQVTAGDEGELAHRGAVVNVSARTGDGLDDLRAEMVRLVQSDAMDLSSHDFWLGTRHREAVRRAAESLRAARKAFDDDLGPEFAAADLRAALTALGDIVGRTTPDDILDTIFSQFCIGK